LLSAVLSSSRERFLNLPPWEIDEEDEDKEEDEAVEVGEAVFAASNTPLTPRPRPRRFRQYAQGRSDQDV
jgi:hypothetical protein